MYESKEGNRIEAYKLMEGEIAAGRNSNDNIRDYFNFYIKDKKYAEGIAKATEYIATDSLAMYFAERAELNNANGNSDVDSSQYLPAISIESD